MPILPGTSNVPDAANLVEHVLPPVPLRQWGLTLPFELRGRLGFDGKLLGASARLFVDSVLGWYRRRLRKCTGERCESGAVVVVRLHHDKPSRQMGLFDGH